MDLCVWGVERKTITVPQGLDLALPGIHDWWTGAVRCHEGIVQVIRLSTSAMCSCVNRRKAVLRLVGVTFFSCTFSNPHTISPRQQEEC